MNEWRITNHSVMQWREIQTCFSFHMIRVMAGWIQPRGDQAVVHTVKIPRPAVFRKVRANKPKATVTFAGLPMTVTLHDWPEGLLCSADHTNLKGSMQLLRNLHKNSPFDSLDATIPTCNYLGIYTRAKVTNWPSSRLLIHVSSPLGCSRSLAARRTAWDLFLPKCKKI